MFAFVVAAAIAAPVQERIVDLPADGDAWYCTVFGDVGDLFDATPSLRTLRERSHFGQLGPEWHKRYGVTQTPALLIQDAVGNVIYRASGSSLSNPEVVDASVRVACWRWHLRRRCTPEPDAEPEPPPVAPVPEYKPPVRRVKSRSVFSRPWLLAAACAAGFCGGAGAAWGKSKKRKVAA